MSDITLHHYPVSAFSEKVRLALGYKGLTWQSVIIPAVMPKPDLIPLTGGYRKTPVMQVGADVYCDTRLMLRELDRRHPENPLFPAHCDAATETVADWADQTLFLSSLSIVFQQPAGYESFAKHLTTEEREQLQKDRASFMKGGGPRWPELSTAQAQFNSWMTRMERQLVARGPFLFGDKPTAADFAVMHPLWLIITRDNLADSLDAWPAVKQWLQDVQALGHGNPEKLSGKDALAIAREAEPEVLPESVLPDPAGLQPGDTVEVAAIDYGQDPVQGEIAYIGPGQVSVRRSAKETGEVVVHFPRIGFDTRGGAA
jgi:glutathione S-transferase